MLTPSIKSLDIKKLVNGIRIDPNDKGEQSRVTTLDYLAGLKRDVDYVVVSSRYVDRPKELIGYISKLAE